MLRSVRTPSTKENYDARQDLLAEYGSLPDGVSASGAICPKCSGGQSHEGSLSVTCEGGQLKFLCHRASCDFRGVLTINGRALVPATDERPERKPIGPGYAAIRKGPLPEAAKEFLWSRYGLTDDHINRGLLQWTTAYSPEGKGRVLMPVRDCDGHVYGHTVRKIDDQRGKKSLTFVGNSSGAWYHCPGSRDVILVEDQISAIRASSYLNAVALLGTNITDKALRDIKESEFNRVFLCLDADALPRAIELVQKHKADVKLHLLQLNWDIKDMTEKDLVQFLVREDVYTGGTLGLKQEA